MASASNMQLSKCCCCSLRAGSIVVGSFALVVSLVFMGLMATSRSGLFCTYTCTNDKCSRKCEPENVFEKMIANQLCILAILNAAEVVLSIGLIWGACKRDLIWITRWLIATAVWILLHFSFATSVIFAINDPGMVSLTAVLGTFILAMALVAMLAVNSFHKELESSQLINPGNYGPTSSKHATSFPTAPSGVD